MIRTITCCIAAWILIGCSQSKWLMRQGQYHEAVMAAAERLRYNKKNEKEALRLEEAFRIAQEHDFSRIRQLRAEGNPNNLREIYALYERINLRQNTVAPLLPIFLRKNFRNADIQITDISREMAEAKNQSIEFTYQSALKLLNSSSKADIRKAHAMLEEVERMYPNYKDVVNQKRTAAQKGVVHVGVVVKNLANVVLPRDFDNHIRNFSTWQLNQPWVQFHNTYNPDTRYDFTIVMNITGINVSPEQVATREFEETKQIQDGFEYVTDKRGNVMKDTAGNDMKRPKMVTVKALVTETRQFKTALLCGNWEIRQIQNNRQIADVPFAETMTFENYYATFRGDRRALSQQTLGRIGGRPVPFPSDFQLINDAAELAKAKLKASVVNNIAAFLTE